MSKSLLLTTCEWLSDALSRNQIVSDPDRRRAHKILEDAEKLGKEFEGLAAKSYPPNYEVTVTVRS